MYSQHYQQGCTCILPSNSKGTEPDGDGKSISGCVLAMVEKIEEGHLVLEVTSEVRNGELNTLQKTRRYEKFEDKEWHNGVGPNKPDISDKLTPK